MLRKFFNLDFGSISVEELFKVIFILGVIPIVIAGFAYLFTGLGFSHIISNLRIDVLILGLIIIAFFVLFSIAVWKIVCELLYLVFRSLEVYIHKNR